ncbi:MAG: hypothetical protein M1828_006419 [Chrysothrix sp. TS-e1954]|nr:MAG: hypothetical protein M1828_006419 [Chrysothrix sp. TS-e1954]
MELSALYDGTVERARRKGSGQNQKKPYKVVLESVTQEKKKLNSLVSYSSRAPPGFTFVPIGAPEITEYCKELSRKQERDVYIVSDGPSNNAHKDPDKISHHIHRIGHHFPNDIVDKTCRIFGNRYRRPEPRRPEPDGRNGRNVRPSTLAARLDRHGERLGLRGNNVSLQDKSQQVSDTIKELFPEVPKEDLESIVSRAFESGSGRVGTVSDLSLARRVQLAVIAHIRHSYTHYDSLLKCLPYAEARAQVEATSLERLMAWRGELQSDGVELEDIFREVIIIDDEDEKQSDHNDGDHRGDDEGEGGSEDDEYAETGESDRSFRGSSADRSPSIEIVSSRKRSPAPATIRHAGDLDIISVPPRRTIEARRIVDATELHHSSNATENAKVGARKPQERRQRERKERRKQKLARRAAGRLDAFNARQEASQAANHRGAPMEPSLTSELLPRSKRSKLASASRNDSTSRGKKSQLHDVVESVEGSQTIQRRPRDLSSLYDYEHAPALQAPLPESDYTVTISRRPLELRTRHSAMPPPQVDGQSSYRDRYDVSDYTPRSTVLGSSLRRRSASPRTRNRDGVEPIPHQGLVEGRLGHERSLFRNSTSAVDGARMAINESSVYATPRPGMYHPSEVFGPPRYWHQPAPPPVNVDRNYNDPYGFFASSRQGY